MTPGITNNNLSTEESFPAHAIIYVRGYDATPTSEEPSPGELPASKILLLSSHSPSWQLQTCLTERMRIERNNHK